MYALSSDAAESPRATDPIPFEADAAGVRVAGLRAAPADARRPKLLVLPGSFGAAERLAPALLRGLGAGFDWLCPDMPAATEAADFGAPALDRAALAFGELAGRAFDGAPYGILGISMGGIVGAAIARTRPDAVAALALDDPAVATASQTGVRAVVSELFARMPPGPWRTSMVAFAREALGVDPESGVLAPLDHGSVFSGIRTPLLIVAGDAPRARTSGKPETAFDSAGEGAIRSAYSGPFLSIVRIAGLGHACLFAEPDIAGPLFDDFFGANLGAGGNEGTLAARGLERARAGDLGAAYRFFLRVAALRPDDPGAAWFAGAIALQAGDPRAALGPLARACALPGRHPDWMRALETVLRAAPAGTYEAYRAALRAVVTANPDDEALLRAYVAAFPGAADPVGDAAFLAHAERPSHGPGTRAQVAFARVAVLRRLGDAAGARDIARANVDAWNSQSGDLTLLLSELYAGDVDDSRIARAKAAYYTGLERRGAERRPPPPRGSEHARPRLGFVSACFDQDAYMPLAHPILGALDADAVETFLFPLGGTGVLPATERALRGGCVSPVPVLGFDTENDPAAWRAAADHIRGHDLDLLIDLDDVLAPFSARLLMLRPARRQATWFNMSGPNPDVSIDHVLGPESLYPKAQDAAFAGKAGRLPADCFVFDPDCVSIRPPPVVPGPISRGEPLTFGSLSHQYKIGDTTLDLWAKVLRAVPQARFRLANADVALPGVAARIWHEFEQRGVARDRVSFAVAHGWPHYLDAYRDIDIALATVPVAGGTTIFHAAWQGVEVLSRVHNSPLGRIGRWLADAIGRPQTAHDTDEGVVADAVRIAADSSGILAWRRDARDFLRSKSRVDAARMARAFEALARG